MAVPLTGDQARLLRLRAQRLWDPQSGPGGSAAQVVKAVCGIQAQDLPAALLGVRARSAGLLAAGVEEARLQERSILRMWCMRGTLHLVSVEDYSWMLPLFGPVIIAASRRRYVQLGLSDEILASGVRVIQNALADMGPLTRHELARQLEDRGIPAAGQAKVYLISHAAQKGILCEGPSRGREPAYILTRDWISPEPPLSRETALSELALRYLSAYGPAGPEDLASWSGMGRNDVRSAWESVSGQLVQVDLDGRPAWMPASRRSWLEERLEPSVSVRLLPRFDSYLLGYTGRELILEPQYEKRVHPGGGILNAVILVDGRVVGTWETRKRRGGLEVILNLFYELPGDARAGMEAEAVDLARFLGVPLSQEGIVWNAG